MTNRVNVRNLARDEFLSKIGPRVSGKAKGDLDQKKRRKKAFRGLSDPDFHETMFEAGRAFCMANPTNYERMRALYTASVAATVKDKKIQSSRGSIHSPGGSRLGLADTKPLNISFRNVNPQADMATFGEEPHEYAIRCAIYVLTGRSQVNGNAPLLRSTRPYTT